MGKSSFLKLKQDKNKYGATDKVVFEEKEEIIEAGMVSVPSWIPVSDTQPCHNF